MCDFSQYGGPSAEWLELEKTLPATAYDISQPPTSIRNIINEGRNQISQAAMKDLAPKVRMQDFSIPTRDGSSLEARSYRSATSKEGEILPVYLHFHGGGFLFGTLGSEDAACANLALRTGIVVFNVNYRHTPEHPFPTAWLDTQDSFVWLHKHSQEVGIDPAKVVVGGVSAGGQLTASLVLEKHLGVAKELQGLPDIAGQVLIIPCLQHLDTYADGPLKQMKSPEVSSYVENKNAPMLPKTIVEFFLGLLQASNPDLKDTKLNPGNASQEEVKGLPPAVFGIAGLDPLRDEGLLYAKKLSEAGVPTDTYLFKGVPHGHRRFGAALKASQDWDDVMANGILWTLKKPKATGVFDVQVLAR